MKQLNTFAADDLALCRAHGDAVGALVKASDVREPSAADYNLGLAGWLMELANRPRMIVGVDPAKPGSDTTAVALVQGHGATDKAAQGDAYVSAKQPDQAEVWHDGPPPVAGVYWAESKPAECAPGMFLRHFNGVMWSRHWRAVAPADFAATRRDGEHTASCEQISWFRLIEADKPAETAAPAAATHSVCIKAHHNLAGAMNHVGDVIEYGPASRHVPECWLPCDKAGWVSHVPTADSGCPVPSGVKFDTLRRSGYVCLFGETPPYAWELGFRHSRTASPGDIVAWRPTGAAA